MLDLDPAEGCTLLAGPGLHAYYPSRYGFALGGGRPRSRLPLTAARREKECGDQRNREGNPGPAGDDLFEGVTRGSRRRTLRNILPPCLVDGRNQPIPRSGFPAVPSRTEETSLSRQSVFADRPPPTTLGG
jgi:hypothetical protein